MLAYCSRICILYDLYETKYEEGTNVCLMSFCQELSLPFIAIQTHLKLLCVFMAPTLCVSMTNKEMGRKWFSFKSKREENV